MAVGLEVRDGIGVAGGAAVGLILRESGKGGEKE
jgi:hypothetical protein